MTGTTNQLVNMVNEVIPVMKLKLQPRIFKQRISLGLQV